MTIHSLIILSSFASVFLYGNTYSHNYTWGKIRGKIDGTCLEAVNGKVIFQTCHPRVASQFWHLTSTGQLRYQEQDGEISNYCLDVPTESEGAEGAALQTFQCGNSTSSQWSFQKAGEKTLSLRSSYDKAANQCLAFKIAGQDAVIRNCALPDTHLLLENADTSLAGFDAFPEAALAYHDVKKESWMETIFYTHRDKPITKIILPGTHNSGTYQGFSSISTTQNRSVLEQLRQGERHVEFRPDVRSMHGLVITHGDESGPQGSLETVLSEIENFAKLHPKEVIIVDIHEVPTGSGTEADSNRTLLAKTIAQFIGDYLIKSDGHIGRVTLNKIWQAQTYNEKRNIILMLRSRGAFAGIPEVFDYSWNRDTSLLEEWPEATDFKTIYLKNHSFIVKQQTNPGLLSKMHVSQFIRTFDTGYGVLSGAALLFGMRLGPFELTTQKTADGYFNHSIDKWLIDFVTKEKGAPNVVITDFSELTNLVPAAIWLNMKANGYSS